MGRNETQQLIDYFGKSYPKIVEDLTPKPLGVAIIQKVMQQLLDESVHIRDLRTIMETLADFGNQTQDVHELVAMVRIALGKAIVQEIAETNEDLSVMVLDGNLEQLISQSQAAMGQGQIAVDPAIAEGIANNTSLASQRMEVNGKTPVLLVPDIIRNPIARLLRRPAPNLRVLAHSEIPDNKQIKVAQIVTA
jgi:flagellar biosynthesis protein FlhA